VQTKNLSVHGLLELSAGRIVIVSFLVCLIVIAIRKLAYEMYLRLPYSEDHRHEMGYLDSDWDFYWVNRGDFFFWDIALRYGVFVLIRIDKYIPVIDCDKQRPKANYFHKYGFFLGMKGFQYRRVNPEAWPLKLLRFVFLSPLKKLYNIINRFEKQSNHNATAKDGIDPIRCLLFSNRISSPVLGACIYSW
jgi:hypothetical protein